MHEAHDAMMKEILDKEKLGMFKYINRVWTDQYKEWKYKLHMYY